MKELTLKYGCNPNQKSARIYMTEGELPIDVLNGRPGFINFLDALNAWQLVRELKQITGLAAAASFKHVSPAGAALGIPLNDVTKKICFVDDIYELNSSPIACAYARARGADRMSSFGDFIALSDICDEVTARIIQREVSDGIIAPGYTDEALNILRTKRKGNYSVVKIDPYYEPEETELKQVFGIYFEQNRNNLRIDESLPNEPVTKFKEVPQEARLDLLLALTTLKYTQSNSVCYTFEGQTIGVGAGQQSRIHCTRLAGDKADIWRIRHHPKVLSLPLKNDIKRPERDNVIDVYISRQSEDVIGETRWHNFFTRRPEPIAEDEMERYLASGKGISLGSDAFFPFGDNIERARRSGVSYIAQPGGSIRDDDVIAACDACGIAMYLTGQRLFHH